MDTRLKTKPSFLEGGLPAASLSAECQRDNNARQRPPQNRLHIWWARRPPTISRAAILAALLPHDLELKNAVLPQAVSPPSASDLESLPPKLEPYRAFFEGLLDSVKPTAFEESHLAFLRVLGVTGDPYADYRRIAEANDYLVGGKPLQMPTEWGYRHPPAFAVTPSSEALRELVGQFRDLLGLAPDEPAVALDFMGGGGAIPLEAVRYGLQTYANDLNPVAALVLKATIQYPAAFGHQLLSILTEHGEGIAVRVQERLEKFFFHQRAADCWSEIESDAIKTFKARAIVKREPIGFENIQATLWCRTVDCPKCALKIPISTNLQVVNKKGQPEKAIAAFPEVPQVGQGNECSFRIVCKTESQDCRWPKPGFDRWHPRETPTFKDGKAECPRCGTTVSGEQVKAQGQAREGGLPAQMYAVASKVPVRLTYQNGDIKVRYLWRFRAPTSEDLAAVRAAEEELQRRLPQWQTDGLVPDEEVPEVMEDKRPREYGMPRWRDLFLPRQLLTNLVILEEIRAAQERVRAELPEDQAEAVAVYLAFMLDKVVNYNSVNTFWHYGRQTVAQTFSRHDFAFRPAFCEFEGARETVIWAANQVIDSYAALCALIHGGDVDLAADDEVLDDAEDQTADAEADDESPDAEGTAEEDMPLEQRRAAANGGLRPEVTVPTVTCQDAAGLSTPAPGSVHLICVDPPYYNNVQYAELSNFFYVWLKRALKDWPGLAHLFTEPLAETQREAVANTARWQEEAEHAISAWQTAYDAAFTRLREQKLKVAQAKAQALAEAGPKPPSAKERAGAFYESKMAGVFARGRKLLHPAGRMVVMFNHKQTWAWRSLGMALIRAGFEVRSSVPIHTEAESSLNIRGLDAARSTVLLMCLPREEREQAPGNWAAVQTRVGRVAQAAAARFQGQGLSGTDLYLASLGPALGEVGRNWPVTDFAGREIDLVEALEEAYKAVGQWRLEQIFTELTASAELGEAAAGFSAQSVDRDTQTLWLWLDTFQGEIADSDDVRKLAKSLGVDPDDLKGMGLLTKSKDLFLLRPPREVDHRTLSRRLKGDAPARGRAAREADAWEERVFPGFIGAAVWNALGLMTTTDGIHGPDALRRWMTESGYGNQREFIGAYAVTLGLVERVFQRRRAGDAWNEAARQARRGWDLVVSTFQA